MPREDAEIRPAKMADALGMARLAGGRSTAMLRSCLNTTSFHC